MATLNVLLTFYLYVDNKYHFVFVCEHYSYLRTFYFPLYFYNDPNNFKYKLITITDNDTLMLKMCKYMFHSFKRAHITECVIIVNMHELWIAMYVYMGQSPKTWINKPDWTWLL